MIFGSCYYYYYCTETKNLLCYPNTYLFFLLLGCADTVELSQESYVDESVAFSSIVESISGVRPSNLKIKKISDQIPQNSLVSSFARKGLIYDQLSMVVEMNNQTYTLNLISSSKGFEKSGDDEFEVFGEIEIDSEVPILFKSELTIESEEAWINSLEIIDDNGEAVQGKIIIDSNGHEICDYSDVRGTGRIPCARRCMSCLLSTDGYTGQGLAILGILSGVGCRVCAYVGAIGLGLGSLGCAGGC